MPMMAIRPEWALRLKDFSRRNAGRRTRLEIDDPELGAQWAEVACTLRGVAYDTRTGRVEIMLEDGAGYGAHLTHSIVGTSGLDVLADAQGRDATLRIAHPGGQTLLSLYDA